MRSENIAEALLEMRYFPVFLDCIRALYGRAILRVIKPSQREEAFLGFDQGFACSQLSGNQLRQQLRAAIANPASPAPPMYVGYFLQYKCPEHITRRSKSMPTGFQAPYFRFELSMDRNPTAGRSQHETLVRLQQLPNADVSYVCPLVFTEEELLADPDVDDLMIVPVQSAPAGYATNERHFVAWQSRDDMRPFWCSEPIEGRAWKLRPWLERHRHEPMSGPRFVDWLLSLYQVAHEQGPLASALVILELAGEATRSD